MPPHVRALRGGHSNDVVRAEFNRASRAFDESQRLRKTFAHTRLQGCPGVSEFDHHARSGRAHRKQQRRDILSPYRGAECFVNLTIKAVGFAEEHARDIKDVRAEVGENELLQFA